MKRVTILVDDIGETDEDGERLLEGLGSAAQCVWIAADRVLSVEDHVEPLPTEPGARFWGQLGDTEPQWWFTRGVDDGVYYLPARGAAVYANRTEAYSLVRLPDPKPTDGDAR